MQNLKLGPALFQQLFISFLSFTTCLAQTDSISFSAFIDTYYAFDFNEPQNNTRQYANMVARHNEFNINHAFLMAEYNGPKIRGELGIQAGNYPDINYAQEPSDFYKLMYKASVGVKVHPKVWLDAGLFQGHFGYEVVESLLNENYSKSMPAEYTPYYQTGVRATIELSKKVYLYLVVLNGWQNIIETNDAKAFGMDIDFFPNDKIEINYGNYFGDQGNGLVGSKFRYYHEGYIKYHFSEKFHSVLTFDVGWQEMMSSDRTAYVYFFTLISEYKLTDQISFASRIEYDSDKDQILIDTNSADGFEGQIYTLTANYWITPKAMFRIEGKYYQTNGLVFNAGNTPSKDNTLLAASIAVEF